MYKNNAKLFVISAPSGCGKGTILAEVFKNRDVFYSISCTTRKPRDGEKDGVHYHFISDDSFKKMIDSGEFLEHAGYVTIITEHQRSLFSLILSRAEMLYLKLKLTVLFR